MLPYRMLLAAVAAALVAAVPGQPDHRFDAESIEFFEKQVGPLLVNNCNNCHSASTNAKGGLRIDDRNGLLQGANRGPDVVPGDPGESLLIQAVLQTDEELKMPPKNHLSTEEIAVLTKWIKDGTAWPEVDAGAILSKTGVIQSYELAFTMQGKVPELLDISREPRAVLDMYGVKPGPAGSFARQCLMARRLSEAGVRFVEVSQPGWDHHTNLHQGLIRNSTATDQPTAALLADLDQRGLPDETLVLFGSEFGRLPTSQGKDGRDHNITGFPMWLAGAGVKKGFSYGATDEYGINAVDGRMHSTDLHATLLALMGLDHERLTYRYAGRDFRLTDVAGNVVREIMA